MYSDVVAVHHGLHTKTPARRRRVQPVVIRPVERGHLDDEPVAGALTREEPEERRTTKSGADDSAPSGQIGPGTRRCATNHALTTAARPTHERPDEQGAHPLLITTTLRTKTLTQRAARIVRARSTHGRCDRAMMTA